LTGPGISGTVHLVVLGQVIAPRGSEASLGTALRRVSGQVVYYPYVDGGEVRTVHSGVVSGESLANLAGQPADVLIATSQLVVTSPIQRLGYHQVVALGHAVVPKDTDPTLLAHFTTVIGQIVSYTAPVRVFDGKDHFSAGFFELLDEPITLVLDGKFSFDADIAPELLRQKVAAIVLDGKVAAPRRLVPMLQLLCVARDGKIQADDESE
jgi:hypothetical protein